MSLLVFVLGAPVTQSFSQQPLQEIPGCVYIDEDWADGDSFRIKTPEGKMLTVRLYGADCIESVIRDESDVTRLRAQRRYFGIENHNENVSDSIKLAMRFGEDATKMTKRLLAKPFTIQTSFADARGDARYERIYAFVITSDGKDLAAELVSEGLARAFGVSRSALDGRSRDDYQAEMQDIELKAAREEKGVWAFTDWEKLPAERSVQRNEDREAQIAMGDGKLKEGEKIKVMGASEEDFRRLPGIGEGLAKALAKRGSFRKPEDLMKVDGIGEKTLAEIEPFLDFSEE